MGHLSPDQSADLAGLVDRAHTDDDPFDEAARAALVRGSGQPGERFVALVARTPDGRPVGYAQVVQADGQGDWSLALAVDPPWRDGSQGLGQRLLNAARKEIPEEIREETGGHLAMWVGSGRSWLERLALDDGWESHRSLYRMQRPLPVGERSGLAVRAFRVGQDEDAWLAVNNRAFAGHPEQGDWTRADLDTHEAYDWFDPNGFLLFEDEGRLQGFCWTKLHHGTDPLIGEIYVIATDPAASGRGLGRRLVVAGLDHLAARGATVAMLYTESGNIPAVRLYVSLGFTVEGVRRLYRSRR